MQKERLQFVDLRVATIVLTAKYPNTTNTYLSTQEAMGYRTDALGATADAYASKLAMKDDDHYMGYVHYHGAVQGYGDNDDEWCIVQWTKYRMW